MLARLSEDEELFDVELVGIGGWKPGLLAITDRRLLHLYRRRILPGWKVTELKYEQLGDVRNESWRSFAELKVRPNRGRKTLNFPVLAGSERAAELESCIRTAKSGFLHRSAAQRR